MKEILIIACLCFVCITLNAQKKYFGGSLCYRKDQYGSEKNYETIKAKYINFGLQTEVGFYLNEEWDFGIEVGIGRVNSKNYEFNYQSRSMYLSFSPFFRYSMIKINKIELLGKGTVFIRGRKNDDYQIGTSFIPVLAYNVNNNIAWHLDFDFIGISFFYYKIYDSDEQGISIFHGFENDFKTVGDIKLSLIYKF